MTIEFSSVPDGQQATVSCDGSVATMIISPSENTHGIGWLILEDHAGRNEGEAGRPVPPELMTERWLQDQPGVVIGVRDPRSCDTIIECLQELKVQLEARRCDPSVTRADSGEDGPQGLEP